MLHKNNDPSQGFYVVNTIHGGIVFHEPGQKVKPHEREATEEDLAAASDDVLIRLGLKEAPPVVAKESPLDLSALVTVKATGTVSNPVTDDK